MEPENHRTQLNVSHSENYHHVTSETALEEGDRVLLEINGVEIGVFRTETDFYAVANYCPHQGGPLCTGPVSGRYTAKKRETGWELQFDHDENTIVCPWHGWEFDMEDGDHTAFSRTRAITYNVEVIDGQVYINDPKL